VDTLHFFVVVTVVTVAVLLTGVYGVWLLHAATSARHLSVANANGAAALGLLFAGMTLAAAFVTRWARAVLIPCAPLALALALWIMAWSAAPVVGIGAGAAGLPLLLIAASLATGWAFNSLLIPLERRTLPWSFYALAGLAAFIATVVLVAPRLFLMPVDATASPFFVQLYLGLHKFGLMLVAALAGILAALRVDDWLLFGRLPHTPTVRSWQRMARTTPLPVLRLEPLLLEILDSRDGPRNGVEMARTLFHFTQQQSTVQRALAKAVQGPKPTRRKADDKTVHMLAAAERSALERRTELAIWLADRANALPWRFFNLAPRPNAFARRHLERGRQARLKKQSAYTQRMIREEWLRALMQLHAWPAPLMTDTPSRAVTTGLAALESSVLFEAAFALKRARNAEGAGTPPQLLREINEMTQSLETLSLQPDLAMNDSLAPPERPLLPERRLAWDQLEHLYEAVKLAAVARRCSDQRLHTMARQMALQELAAAAAAPTPPPGRVEPIECRAMRRLAAQWRNDPSLEIGLDAPLPPLDPVRNPYLHAEPMKRGAEFVRRDPQLLVLQDAWSERQLLTVTLRAPHHAGKTSLLAAVQGSLRNVETMVLSLNHVTLGQALLPSMLLAISNAARKVAGRGVLAPPVLPGGAAYPLITPGFAPGVDPFMAVEQAIKEASELVFPRPLVLILDDFDRVYDTLTHAQAAADLMTLLNHLVDQHANFGALFVRQARLREAGLAEHALLRRSLVVDLPPLTAQQVARLLRPERTPVRFTPEAVATGAALSGGSPWVVQLLAHAAVGLLNGRLIQGAADPLLDLPALNEALAQPEVRNQLEMHHRRLIDEAFAGLTTAQGDAFARWLGLVATLGPTPRRPDEIFEEARRFNPSSQVDAIQAQQQLDRMVECFLLTRAEGQYAVNGELLRGWIRENQSAIPQQRARAAD
jgi:hypothetical protein